MNEPPITHKSEGKKYFFIKAYSYIYLYEDRNGLKECFTPQELGLVPKIRVTNMKWNKMERGEDIKPENKFRW